LEGRLFGLVINAGVSTLFDGDEYDYFFFVTNTELPSEKVVISYEKRGNGCQ